MSLPLAVGTPPAPVDPTITVDLLEPDGVTLVTALDMSTVVDGQVEDPIQGDGLGQLQVGLESPNAVALRTRGRVLRWNGTGEFPFHSIIEANDQISLTADHTKTPRQITVRGRGLIAQWDKVRVGQWPGMEHAEIRYRTRHFNYASPGKASRINDTAYSHGLVLDFDADGQPNNPAQPPPSTWRESTTERIWSAAYSGSQATGTSLFATTLTPTAGTILRGHDTADDRFIKWVGGVPVSKGPDTPDVTWHDTFGHSTRLQSGVTYPIVFRCENEFSVPPFSIAWLASAGWMIVSPGDGLDPSLLALRTSAAWTALDCTSTPTPGWTVPQIMGVLLDEWQAQGKLSNWVIVDATPEAWEEMPETNFETKKTTGLGVINQLGDGQAEFATVVDGGQKQLICFAPGTMGNYHLGGTAPEIDHFNIADLSFQWVQS